MLVGSLFSFPTSGRGHTPTFLHASLLITFLGVVWAGLVRFLFLRSLKHHKIHYKLSDTLNGGSGTLMGGASLGGGGGRERLKVEVPLAGVKGVSPKAGFSWRQTTRKAPVM